MLVRARPTQDTTEKSTGVGRDSFQCRCSHLCQDSPSATASCNLHAVATPQIPPMKMPNRLLTARKDVNVVQNEVPI